MITKKNSIETPLIGILCWEENCSPRGLEQLESLVGNSTNPNTFQFPVKYSRIKGANIHTILESPCQNTLKSMIKEAQDMEEKGIKAITTSCGFNAIFQKKLADAVTIPVFTSSLMQVPIVKNMLGPNKIIGVITAKKSALSTEHLQNAGINSDVSIHIEGLETFTEWNKMFLSPNDDIDLAKIESDILDLVSSMMKESDIGAFILECTDLPPFANAIRKVTGRPVFDFVTLTNFVHQSL
jgi:Asp/Glu/hydantoin racemase